MRACTSVRVGYIARVDHLTITCCMRGSCARPGQGFSNVCLPGLVILQVVISQSSNLLHTYYLVFVIGKRTYLFIFEDVTMIRLSPFLCCVAEDGTRIPWIFIMAPPHRRHFLVIMALMCASFPISMPFAVAE